MTPTEKPNHSPSGQIKNRARSGTVMSSSTIIPPTTPTSKSFGVISQALTPTKPMVEGNEAAPEGDAQFQPYRPYPPVKHLEPLPRTTYPFTNLEGLNLELDLYIPELSDDQKKVEVPVLFFVHSGGHVTGSKLGHPLHEIEEALQRGWAVVSPNYPLAPQSNVSTQVKAINEAWNWVVNEARRRECSKSGEEVKLDVGKIMVAGGSAAATLLILSLSKLEPKPAAQFLLYPFLTLMEKEGDTADLSDLGALAPPAQEAASLDAENLRKVDEIINGQVGGKKAESPMEDFFRLALHPYHLGIPFEPQLDANTKFLFSAAVRPGKYRSSVLGFDYEDPSFIDQRNSLDVFQIVKQVHFPPTFIVQGEKDTVTPIHLTEKFVSKMRSNGDNIQFVKLKDQSHVFDFLLRGKNDDGSGIWSQSIGKGFDFLEGMIRLESGNQDGAADLARLRMKEVKKGELVNEPETCVEVQKEKMSSAGWIKSIGRAGTQFGKMMIKNAVEKKKSLNFGVLKRKSQEKIEFDQSHLVSPSATPSSPLNKVEEAPLIPSVPNTDLVSDGMVQALRSNSTSNRRSFNPAQTQSRRSSARLSYCSNDSQLSLALSGSNASSRRNSALITSV